MKSPCFPLVPTSRVRSGPTDRGTWRRARRRAAWLAASMNPSWKAQWPSSMLGEENLWSGRWSVYRDMMTHIYIYILYIYSILHTILYYIYIHIYDIVITPGWLRQRPIFLFSRSLGIRVRSLGKSSPFMAERFRLYSEILWFAQIKMIVMIYEYWLYVIMIA